MHTNIGICIFTHIHMLKICLGCREKYNTMLMSAFSAFLSEQRVESVSRSNGPDKWSLYFANLRVYGLWEGSLSEIPDCNPLWSRRAQGVSLRTTVHRVVRWFALVISGFPSWPPFCVSFTSCAVVTFQVVRGWAIIPKELLVWSGSTLTSCSLCASPHLCKATWVPDMAQPSNSLHLCKACGLTGIPEEAEGSRRGRWSVDGCIITVWNTVGKRRNIPTCL